MISPLSLPYDPRVSIAFDHHESGVDRLKAIETNGKLIIDPWGPEARLASSMTITAERKPSHISGDLMTAVDKGDSADFTSLRSSAPPAGSFCTISWMPETGLGRFHEFRISNYELMMETDRFLLLDHDIDRSSKTARCQRAR